MTFYVLGDEDVVTGFRFINIKGKIIETREDAVREFRNLTGGVYGEAGIILITEKVSVFIEQEIMDWQLEGKFPLIVEIPDLDGHMESKKTMLEAIREAIGLSI